MRIIKLFAAVAILIVSCAASFLLGLNTRSEQQQKDYEAACILSDICRYQLDYHDEDGEFEELYYDVIGNLDCYNVTITKEELHQNYSWCY